MNKTQSKIFLNTKKSIDSSKDACIRILDVNTFEELDRVNCQPNTYFKRMQIIDDNLSSERLIATGGFGLLVYDCISKKKPEIKPAENGKGFIGVNFIPEYDIILAAEDHRIAFFNSNNLEDPAVIDGNDQEDLTVTLSGYLSDIAVSHQSIKKKNQFLALGDQYG